VSLIRWGALVNLDSWLSRVSQLLGGDLAGFQENPGSGKAAAFNGMKAPEFGYRFVLPFVVAGHAQSAGQSIPGDFVVWVEFDGAIELDGGFTGLLSFDEDAG
jgi:hypothetical protein